MAWLAVNKDGTEWIMPEHHNSKDEKAYLYLMLNVYI